MVDKIKSDSEIQLAGEIRILDARLIRADGKGLSILGIFNQIQISEELASPFMQGSITIIDTRNLLTSLPIIGEEKLILKYRTPNMSIDVEKTFYIVKCSTHFIDSDKKHTYVLEFVSKSVFYNMHSKLSRAYSGTGNEIIKKIFNDGLNVTDTTNTATKVVMEETFNKFKFIAQNWDPFTCIAYAAGRSQNAKGASDFLFFETMYFHRLASASTLLSSDPVTEFFFDKRSMRISDVDNTTSRNLELQYKMAKNFDFISSFDIPRETSTGILSNMIVGYDLLSKRFSYTKYDYLNDFNKTKHLESYPMHSANLLTGAPGLIRSKITAKSTFDGFDIDDTDALLSSKIALFGQLKMYSIRVELPGRTDLVVGMTVNLNIPNYKRVNTPQEGELDPHYSGKYLIVAIRHIFQSNSHVMTIEIAKDSLKKQIDFNGVI